MIYVLIFLAKAAEVTLATMRTVLVNKGMRKDVDATIHFVRQYDGIYATVCDIRSVKIGHIGVRTLK